MHPAIFLIACISLAVGALIVVRACRLIGHCIVARHWPRTPGCLVSVEDRDVSGPEDTTHEIRVRYTYSVEGREFEGDRPHPAYTGGSRFSEAHENLVALLQPGRRVEVIFNPEQPDQSMLSARIHVRMAWPLLIGLGFMGIGVAVLMTEWLPTALGTGLVPVVGAAGVLAVCTMLIDRGDFASGITVLG